MESKVSYNQKILIQELVNEHNKLRKNPQCYIGLLKKVLNLIRRNNILHLENERPFKTIDGKEAVLDAINYLSNIPKSLKDKLSNNLFTLSDYLCQASLDHARDLGINGTCSHIGTNDNSHIHNRVEKYCDWNGGLAESLDFGTNKPQNIMLKLLICDGDKKKSQRQYIFDPGFLYFGAGFYHHIKYQKCTVISYAGFVQTKNSNLTEKEFITNYLNIHRYFINKNKEEFDKYIANSKEKEENTKERAQNIIKNENEKHEQIKDKGVDNVDILKKDNKKEEEINNSNNNLIIIEEVENEHEKEDNNNQIVVINEKKIEKYGLKIKETTYRIKEGNYHIVEEED